MSSRPSEASQAVPQPGSPAETDEQLVAAYVSGDRAALKELVTRYHADLLRFLTRLTGNREIAEDAFQDTFLQLHLSAAKFDTARRFRPWLFTIAANKARDALRKQRRQPLLTLSRPVGDADSVQVVDLMEIATDAPSERLDANEQQEMVDGVLNSLTLPMREVLLLAYFQRLSYAQIAEELGIPLGTVKSRLHAAVAQFARHWKRRHTGDRSPSARPTE